MEEGAGVHRGRLGEKGREEGRRGGPRGHARLRPVRVRPIWGRRGFTRQPENSKRAHFRWRFKHHKKFHERTPKRGRKKDTCGGRGKKARNFGPPTLLGPALRGLPPFGASQFGAHRRRWPEAAPEQVAKSIFGLNRLHGLA